MPENSQNISAALPEKLAIVFQDVQQYELGRTGLGWPIAAVAGIPGTTPVVPFGEEISTLTITTLHFLQSKTRRLPKRQAR
jgi:hypothetical protein